MCDHIEYKMGEWRLAICFNKAYDVFNSLTMKKNTTNIAYIEVFSSQFVEMHERYRYKTQFDISSPAVAHDNYYRRGETAKLSFYSQPIILAMVHMQRN